LSRVIIIDFLSFINLLSADYTKIFNNRESN
jgi:hypothetical protein